MSNKQIGSQMSGWGGKVCRCGRAGGDGEEAWEVKRVVNDTNDNLQ